MILATFPGKYGDLLWALPTIRALSRRVRAPIDLVVAAPFASICPLIAQQDYIAHCAADPFWEVQDTAPMTPRTPPRPLLPPLVEGRQGQYDCVFHLGYRGWPDHPLPFETMACLQAQWPDAWGACPGREELDLQTPWITTTRALDYRPDPILVGFTDEHFELKYGLSRLVLHGQHCGPATCIGTSPRWEAEAHMPPYGWEQSAWMLRHGRVFLGCTSALHVLAVACGTPVVLMEPNPHRHHAIFYPLGDTGPQVTLVRGIDGLPTFDARHVRDTLLAILTSTVR